MNHGNIIKLDPSDYEKCNNIWDMKRHPDKAKLWYDQLVSGNRIIFVYVENDEFIGEGSLLFDRGDPDYTIPGKRIYLSRMIVKKEFRNRGIGGMLIDHMVDYARELGYKEARKRFPGRQKEVCTKAIEAAVLLLEEMGF